MFDSLTVFISENVVTDRVSICIRYMFCYNSVIQNLRDEAKNLEDVREWVELPVLPVKSDVRDVRTEVQSWLKKAEKRKNKADRILEDVDKFCFRRYSLTHKAAKQTCHIIELQSEGKKYWFLSYPAVVTGKSAYFSATDPCELLTLTRTKIRDALKYHTFTLTGICGIWAGIPNFVRRIAIGCRFRYYNIALAVVSQNKDVIKIQDQLAGMLELELEGNTNVLERAEKLDARLRRCYGFLVIFVDVWEALDMAEIGIPTENGHREDKVVIISHDEEVLRQMKVRTIITVADMTVEE